MKSPSPIVPLIALSALAATPSVVSAEDSSTPATSNQAAVVQASTPAPTPAAASTPAPSPASTPSPLTTPATTAAKSDTPSSKRRQARAKARKAQSSRDDGTDPTTPDPTPTSPATDQTLVNTALTTAIPNFQIDNFQIPPFLLPIYQAAGTQYGIPWQVLAGINSVETNFGRDLSVSSAGALGWMQFMPETWAQWGVDADDNGVKDPMNPADAIFAAARYLKAAGGDTDISKGIFAYNHADWYVKEVLTAAKAVESMPDSLVSSLTGLTQGMFPVDDLNAKFAGKVSAAPQKVHGTNVSKDVSGVAGRKHLTIRVKSGAAVVAVQDGTIEEIGQTAKLGHFVRLRDEFGNRYTYTHLGSLQAEVPVPKPVKASSKSGGDTESSSDASGKIDKVPTTAASAGTTASSTALDGVSSAGSTTTLAAPKHHSTKAATTSGPQAINPSDTPAGGDGPTRLSAKSQDTVTSQADPVPAQTVRLRAHAPLGPINGPAKPQKAKTTRLFATPTRPASWSAGGEQQVNPTDATGDLGAADSLSKYFSVDYGLKASQVTLKPLAAGRTVIAGTILGRASAPVGSKHSHVGFMLRPAGKKAPLIDPSPFLSGWRLADKTNFQAAQAKKALKAIAHGQRSGVSTGQILLMGKQELEQVVLHDKRIKIYDGGINDINGGQIDRRVLATLEFLAESGLNPTVSCLKSGHSLMTTSGNVSEHSTGDAVDISEINGIPITGHQGPGTITDTTIQKLLTLQGNMKPHQIISLMQFAGADNTLAMSDHYNHIHVGFRPVSGNGGAGIETALKPGQWDKLVAQLSSIQAPTVSTTPSKYAVVDSSAKPTAP